MNKIFLFTGIFFILVALFVLWAGGSHAFFLAFLAIGILLKIVFLVNVFREKGFRWSLGLTLISTGVGMILLSLLFKSVFPQPVLRNVLFFGAIGLKITGLCFLVFSSRRREKPDEKGRVAISEEKSNVGEIDADEKTTDSTPR